MFALCQMRQNQTLPIAIQLVLTANRIKFQACAALQRFQQQMHLCIMAQRFKMSHTLDRCRNRLFVYNMTFSKRDIKSKAFRYHALENFQLNFTHELNMNLLQAFIPYNMQLRIFFFQLFDAAQCRRDVCALRQNQLIRQHR